VRGASLSNLEVDLVGSGNVCSYAVVECHCHDAAHSGGPSGATVEVGGFCYGIRVDVAAVIGCVEHSFPTRGGVGDAPICCCSGSACRYDDAWHGLDQFVEVGVIEQSGCISSEDGVVGRVYSGSCICARHRSKFYSVGPVHAAVGVLVVHSVEWVRVEASAEVEHLLGGCTHPEVCQEVDIIDRIEWWRRWKRNRFCIQSVSAVKEVTTTDAGMLDGLVEGRSVGADGDICFEEHGADNVDAVHTAHVLDESLCRADVIEGVELVCGEFGGICWRYRDYVFSVGGEVVVVCYVIDELAESDPAGYAEVGQPDVSFEPEDIVCGGHGLVEVGLPELGVARFFEHGCGRDESGYVIGNSAFGASFCEQADGHRFDGEDAKGSDGGQVFTPWELVLCDEGGPFGIQEVEVFLYLASGVFVELSTTHLQDGGHVGGSDSQVYGLVHTVVGCKKVYSWWFEQIDVNGLRVRFWDNRSHWLVVYRNMNWVFSICGQNKFGWF